MCEDGEKHATLLKAAKLCGGPSVLDAWRGRGRPCVAQEISKRDIESEEQAVRTIRDGLENGKGMPIRELIRVSRMPNGRYGCTTEICHSYRLMTMTGGLTTSLR